MCLHYAKGGYRYETKNSNCAENIISSYSNSNKCFKYIYIQGGFKMKKIMKNFIQGLITGFTVPIFIFCGIGVLAAIIGKITNPGA